METVPPFTKIECVDDTEPFAGKLVCYEISRGKWSYDAFIIDGKMFAYIGIEDYGSEKARDRHSYYILHKLLWDKHKKQGRLFSELAKRLPFEMGLPIGKAIDNEFLEQNEMKLRHITPEEEKEIEQARITGKAHFVRGDYHSTFTFGF